MRFRCRHYFLYAIVLITQMACVIYSFTGASISPEVKTISIAYFQSAKATVNPIYNQLFTEALKDKFLSQTNLALIERGGDLNLEGEISDYTVAPIAIQGNEQAALNRLKITVKVEFVNKIDEKQNFETSFSAHSDYESTANLSSVEQELMNSINIELVDKIFNKAVVNW